MYVKSARSLTFGTEISGFSQGATGDEAAQYQNILASTQAQLERKFRDPNDPRLYERRKELRRLFNSVPNAFARELYERLESKNDPLGKLFRYKLATPTRNELLGILSKKFGASSKAPTSSRAKVTGTGKRPSRQERRLVQKIIIGQKLMVRAKQYLKTKAQRELLQDMIDTQSTFFPTGYGVINTQGKAKRFSKRNRLEVINKSGSPGQPFFFHYDTRLYLSDEPSIAGGKHRPFAPGHRSWIRLYVRHLHDQPVNYVAGAVVHELMHMALHRFRSIEAKFGTEAARNYPPSAAGTLLDVSAFASHRRTMERHFSTFVDFLNRQPHRSQGNQLKPETASLWADHLVDEIMSYVLQTRVTLAVAEVEAQKKGIGIATGFVPVQFLRDYFRKYWLKDPKDLAVLKTKGAEQIFTNMKKDLEKLVNVIEAHVGP